jgi:hypothetical protein
METRTLLRAAVCAAVVTAMLGIVLPDAAWAGLGEPVPATTPEEAAEAFMARPACAKLLKQMGCTTDQENLIRAELSRRAAFMGGFSDADGAAAALVLILLFAAAVLVVLAVAGIFYGIGWVISELCSSGSDEEPEVFQRQDSSSREAPRYVPERDW